MKQSLVLIALVLFGSLARAESIETPEKYVFYLHGAIIEKGDPRPIHPRWGRYDYPAVVAQLSSYSFQLIAEQREEGTEHLAYAEKVVAQIHDLIDKGVKPENITVVGFSKGGNITTLVSSILKNKQVNFAILAICSSWRDQQALFKDAKLEGHVLSIYEKTDIAGSCQSLADRSPDLSSFKEIVINTGKEHGAFYLPRDEWVKPLIAWINRS